MRVSLAVSRKTSSETSKMQSWVCSGLNERERDKKPSTILSFRRL